MTTQPSAPAARPLRPALVLAAVAIGLACGWFDIANTSIGWHLASGRLILEELRIPHSDPFSFTSGGVDWVDHEWLFQVVVAAVERAGGAPALVLLRSLLVAALAVLLLHAGVRSGLDPPFALLLAAVAVAGARPRFFLRPELVTLLVVPAAMLLLLGYVRDGRRWRVPALAAVVAVGVNAHGGALLVPLLAAGLCAGVCLAALLRRERDWSPLGRGATALGATLAGALVNPWGPALFLVPVRLARLVALPSIPNPEWISPGPAQAPALYAALVAALVVLAARERDPVRWLLLAMGAALALRHVRNVGVFFVLLPVAVAPALSRLRGLGAAPGPGPDPRPRILLRALAVVAALAVAATVAAGNAGRWKPAFSPTAYPAAACDLLDRERLPQRRLYNDVRFGGYLIGRYFPPRQVFVDDRNEVHGALLERMHRLLGGGDLAGFQAFLDGWEVDTALVRYHQPVEILAPGGGSQARRGFSALWFPASRWALVYWDDLAIVLVRREGAPPGLLERLEVRALRPDDAADLLRRAASDPELERALREEVGRKLAEAPDCRRAAELEAALAGIRGQPPAPPR